MFAERIVLKLDATLEGKFNAFNVVFYREIVESVEFKGLNVKVDFFLILFLKSFFELGTETFEQL